MLNNKILNAKFIFFDAASEFSSYPWRNHKLQSWELFCFPNPAILNILGLGLEFKIFSVIVISSDHPCKDSISNQGRIVRNLSWVGSAPTGAWNLPEIHRFHWSMVIEGSDPKPPLTTSLLAMPNLQWYPWKFNLIKNLEDNTVFLNRKVFNSVVS